jgi:hypothetical protein
MKKFVKAAFLYIIYINILFAQSVNEIRSEWVTVDTSVPLVNTNEPAVAVHPTNPETLIVACNRRTVDETTGIPHTFELACYYSHDNGVTWNVK